MRWCLMAILTLATWLPPAHAQARTVILVRHAEKAAPEGDPGLTEAGQQRARDLATALDGVNLTAIITTQYQRTQLTAAPTAMAKGLEPLVLEATENLSADAETVVRALNSLPLGSVALVVGHSNTLGLIVAALGGPRIPDLCDDEFSTLLVLERDTSKGVSLLRSRYGAEEPAAARQCN